MQIKDIFGPSYPRCCSRAPFWQDPFDRNSNRRPTTPKQTRAMRVRMPRPRISRR